MFARLGLWLVCAFVVWNVAFDRYVANAAHEFTREQVLNYQQGRPVTRIDDALAPRVRRAALAASGWGALVLLVGGALTYAFDRQRPRLLATPGTSDRS